jgi:hypothetical protein
MSGEWECPICGAEVADRHESDCADCLTLDAPYRPALREVEGKTQSNEEASLAHVPRGGVLIAA